jgi:hypothetical protein
MAADRSEWAEMAARHISGFMAIETSWWQEFIQDAPAAWLKLRVKLPSVARKVAWLRGQVARTLAVAVDALDYVKFGSGRELIEELLFDGRRSFGKVEDDLIRTNVRASVPEFEVYWGVS